MTSETNSLDVEKILKNRRKQHFEDVANNMQLDKEDTRRSNWNSEYLSVHHNALMLLFVFIAGFQCRAIQNRSK